MDENPPKSASSLRRWLWPFLFLLVACAIGFASGDMRSWIVVAIIGMCGRLIVLRLAQSAIDRTS